MSNQRGVPVSALIRCLALRSVVAGRRCKRLPDRLKLTATNELRYVNPRQRHMRVMRWKQDTGENSWPWREP